VHIFCRFLFVNLKDMLYICFIILRSMNTLILRPNLRLSCNNIKFGIVLTF
jgi:hypothetical protein